MSMFSSVVGAVGNVVGGIIQNDSNEKVAERQMSYQTDMSNTAYQRAMTDMKAAGLNPMLAYSQGGASSPSGSTYHAENIISPAVNSALSWRQADAELNNLKAQNKNISQDTELKKALQKSAEKEADLKANSARVAKNNADLLEKQMPGADVEKNIDTGKYGVMLRYVNRILPAFNSALSAVHLAK